MDGKKVLWYSEEQRKAFKDFSYTGKRRTGYNIGRLEDGREVQYTEMMDEGLVSSWDDAVRLGVGVYVRQA